MGMFQLNEKSPGINGNVNAKINIKIDHRFNEKAFPLILWFPSGAALCSIYQSSSKSTLAQSNLQI